MNLSKCTGQDCSRKESCLRWTTVAQPKYQAWLCEVVLFEKGKSREGCRFYWEIENENSICFTM